jgi:hypothetical protein
VSFGQSCGASAAIPLLLLLLLLLLLPTALLPIGCEGLELQRIAYNMLDYSDPRRVWTAS